MWLLLSRSLLLLSQICILERGNEVRLTTDIHSRFHQQSNTSQHKEGSLTLHPFPFTNVMRKLVSIRRDLFTLGKKLSSLLIVCQLHWWFPGTCASAHMAVVYPVSALALRLVVTLTSAFSILHEALYEPSNQLLVATDLFSFPTAHCRVAEDSRIQHAYDVGCVSTCVLEQEPRTIFWRVSLYILQSPTCRVAWC